MRWLRKLLKLKPQVGDIVNGGLDFGVSYKGVVVKTNYNPDVPGAYIDGEITIYMPGGDETKEVKMEFIPLARLAFATLLLFFCANLQAQSWVFAQGYILSDSTVRVINKPTIVDTYPNLIRINSLELVYDRFEVKNDILTFYLSDGGLMLYSENEEHGPGLVIMYENVRVVLWSKLLETFEIDIR